MPQLFKELWSVARAEKLRRPYIHGRGDRLWLISMNKSVAVVESMTGMVKAMSASANACLTHEAAATELLVRRNAPNLQCR